MYLNTKTLEIESSRQPSSTRALRTMTTARTTATTSLANFTPCSSDSRAGELVVPSLNGEGKFPQAREEEEERAHRVPGARTVGSLVTPELNAAQQNCLLKNDHASTAAKLDIAARNALSARSPSMC